MLRTFFAVLIGLSLLQSAQTADILVLAPSRENPEIEKKDLQDSFVYHPSTQISQSAELEHLVGMRSQVLNAGAAAGSIVPFIDGVPYRAMTYGNTNIFLGTPYEILTMEVVPGPQTSMGHIMHGAVNFTRDLEEKKEVQIMTDFESQYRVNAELNSENQGIHFMGERSTGWRDDSSYYQYKLHFKDEMRLGQTTNTNQFYVNILSQNASGYIQGKESYRSKARITEGNQLDSSRDVWGLNVQHKFEYKQNSLVFYYRAHDMKFDMHWFPTDPTEENSHYSYGAIYNFSAYQTQDSQLNLSLSYDWTRGKLKETQDSATLGGFIQGDHYDYRTRTFFTSAYLNYIKEITSDFSTETGLRLSSVNHKYENQIESGDFGRYRRLDDQKTRYQMFSPTIMINYSPSTQWGFQLKYERPTRSPEVNDLYRRLSSQDNESIPYERAQYLEFIAKWNGNRTHLQNSFYFMDKSNFYFRDSQAENVLGKTRHYGMDGHLGHFPTDNIEWGLFWSLARNIYRFDNNLDQTNPSETINKGNEIVAAPKAKVSSFLSYFFSDTTHLTLRWNSISNYYLNSSNQNQYSGHNLWDLAFTGRFARIDYTFALRNIFDTRYATRADYFQDQYRYFPGRPRHIIASATYAF